MPCVVEQHETKQGTYCNLGSAQCRMPHKLTDDGHVGSIPSQIRCEGVTRSVRWVLENLGLAHIA